MSNEKFKVKFGLAVGDTSATVDGTTGNIVTNGSLTLNGSSSGSTTITQPATGNVITYTLPDADGGAGTVLYNTGFGVLTWSAPPNPFDQSLNTTDNVEFASVKTSSVYVNELRPYDATDVDVRLITLGSGTYQTGKSNIYVEESVTYPNGIAGIGVNSNQWNFSSDGKTYFPHYIFPSADGTTGQFLITDGSGNLSWSDLSGGATFGNITVGVVTDNTISTTTGDLNIQAQTGNVVVTGLQGSLIRTGELRPYDATATGVSMSTTGPGTYQTGKATISITESSTYPNGLAGVTVNSNQWYFSSSGTTQFPHYIFPSADGTAGQVLTTDGGGTLNWTDFSTGARLGNVTVGVDTDQTISTTSGNLILQTAAGVNAGTLTFTAGSNGNVTLVPNGSGSLVLTLANGGNLTNTRNYVMGDIRQSAAQAAGDIYGFGATGTTNPARGVSLSNYLTSTTVNAKRTDVVLRTYGQRNSFIGEYARGTNPSTPLAPAAGVNIVEMVGTGYYGGGGSDGWLSSVSSVGGAVRLNAGENWSTTNTGTNLVVALSPIGSYAGQTLNVLAMNSDGSSFISTNPTFYDKPVAFGGTNANMLDIFPTAVNVGGQTLNINNNQTAGNTNIYMYSGSNVAAILWDGTQIVLNKPLQLQGSSSGYTNIRPPASGAGVNYILPGSQGSANTVLTNDGSGNLSWALPGGGGSTFGNVSIGVDTDQTISTTSGDLILQTAAGVNAGTMTFTAGANGNITLAPNGSGNVALTMNNGGNLTNTRNYVMGNIRQSAAQTAGDIWGFGTGTTNPYRGITLDNYLTSTTVNAKRSGVLLRTYGQRNSFIGEYARGTNPSTPLAPLAGTTLSELVGTGYYGGGAGDGWLSSTSTAGGAVRINTAENWSTTNAGTTFAVALTPVGAYAGVNFTALQFNSAGAAIYGDNPTFYSKPASAGGTGTNMLDIFTTNVNVGGQTLNINNNQSGGNSVIQAYAGSTAGNLTWNGSNWATTGDLYVAGDVKLGGNDILNSSGSAVFSTDSTRSNTSITTDQFNVRGAAVNTNYLQLAANGGDVVLGLSQTRATTAFDSAVFNFQTQRSTDGINYTPTLNGDTIGEYKFNGNAVTGTSPGTAGPTASISVISTEDWNSGAQGSKFYFTANKTGTTTPYSVIQGSPDMVSLNADTTYIRNYDGSQTFAQIDSTAAKFNKPIQINGSTSGSITLSADGTPATQSYTLPQAYPTANGQILVSTTGGAMSWVDASQIASTFAQVQYNGGTITPAAANTEYTFPIDTYDFGSNTSLASNEVTVSRTGTFKISFNIQVQNTDNGQDHIANFWLHKNSTDIPYSNTDYTIVKSGYNVAAKTFLVQLTAGDVISVRYRVSDTALHFPFVAATTTPYVSPSCPALTLQVTPVSA